MKILVAGGAGFIGSHLTQKLLEQGHDVTIVDSYITGREKNIEHLRKNSLLKVVERDIRGISESSDFWQQSWNQIYNLASPASPIDFEKIPLLILETGAIGHRNLLNLARAKSARILLASTSEVYGDPLEHPQNEKYFGNVNPIGVRSCYDESKRFAEALTVAHQNEFQTNACIARIFNTYGPRMRPEDGRVIPSFFSKALLKQGLTIHGDGLQTRSLCYVSDLVDGLIALMNSDQRGPINIGNPTEITIKELADVINQLLQNPSPHVFLPLPENDPLKRRPDIGLAKTLLGWQPRVNLNEGLTQTWAWFKEELTK